MKGRRNRGNTNITNEMIWECAARRCEQRTELQLDQHHNVYVKLLNVEFVSCSISIFPLCFFQKIFSERKKNISRTSSAATINKAGFVQLMKTVVSTNISRTSSTATMKLNLSNFKVQNVSESIALYVGHIYQTETCRSEER